MLLERFNTLSYIFYLPEFAFLRRRLLINKHCLTTTSFRSLSSEVDLNYYRKTCKIAIYQIDVDKGKIISMCNKFVKLIFGVSPPAKPNSFLENNTFKENIVQGLLAF